MTFQGNRRWIVGLLAATLVVGLTLYAVRKWRRPGGAELVRNQDFRPAGQGPNARVRVPAGPIRGVIVEPAGDAAYFDLRPAASKRFDELGLARLTYDPVARTQADESACRELEELLAERARTLGRPELATAGLIFVGTGPTLHFGLSFAVGRPGRTLAVCGLDPLPVRPEILSATAHRTMNGLTAVAANRPETHAEVRRLLRRARDLQLPFTAYLAETGADIRSEAAAVAVVERIARIVSPEAPAADIAEVPAGWNTFRGDDPAEPSSPSDVEDTESPALDPATDWPGWRGPGGDNLAHPSARPPLEWSETRHVRWKIPLDGSGNSSPIVVRGQVMATCLDAKDRLHLTAFDTETGTRRWDVVLQEGKWGHRHDKNSFASSTPCSDGRRTVVCFAADGQVRATAVDLAGEIVWKTAVAPIDSLHGFAASPVLAAGKFVVTVDSHTDGVLVALDPRTGRSVLRAPRPGGASYGSPILLHTSGRAQLILGGNGLTMGYDPATLLPLWQCAGPSSVTAGTPAGDASRVIVSGGYPEKRLIVARSDGQGDVTATHLAWERNQATAYVPSPLVREGKVYLVNDQGVACCLDFADGKERFRTRLGGNFTSSPLWADGRIYAVSEAGRTHVFRAADTFESLAENALDGEVLATPCAVGRSLFLRTSTHLYCLREADPPE